MHLALNSRTQRDGSTDALHIRLILAIVHGVQRALITRDAELASHGFGDESRIPSLTHQRIHCLQFCPSYKEDELFNSRSRNMNRKRQKGDVMICQYTITDIHRGLQLRARDFGSGLRLEILGSIPSCAATSGRYVALRRALSGSVNSKIIPCLPT